MKAPPPANREAAAFACPAAWPFYSASGIVISIAGFFGP